MKKLRAIHVLPGRAQNGTAKSKPQRQGIFEYGKKIARAIASGVFRYNP